jgi:hypothetical protein
MQGSGGRHGGGLPYLLQHPICDKMLAIGVI